MDTYRQEFKTEDQDERLQQIKQALQKKRFSGLTKLDHLYLKNLEEELTLNDFGANPVQWFLQQHLLAQKDALKPSGDKNDTAQQSYDALVQMFMDSLQSILTQRNYGHLSRADQIYLDTVGGHISDASRFRGGPDDIPCSDTPNTAEFVLNHLKQLAETKPDLTKDEAEHLYWTGVKSHVDALEQMFQLESNHGKVWDALGPMADINRNFVNYLKAIIPENPSSLSPVNNNGRRRLLKEALTEHFYQDLHNCVTPDLQLLASKPEDKEPLGDAMKKRTKLFGEQTSHTEKQYSDIKNVVNAYLNQESNKVKWARPNAQEHYYSGKLETEAGKKFAQVMHHFTQIGVARSLTPIFNALKQQADEMQQDDNPEEKTALLNDQGPLTTQQKAQTIQEIADHLYTAFEEVQNMYYTRLEAYLNDALEILHQQHDGDAGLNIEDGFKQYCELILFSGDKDEINATKSDLEGTYSIQYLNKVEHELVCHLKPALYTKRKANAVEIKHLKKNISHFMQANGLHSRLKRAKQEEETDDSRESFLKQRYALAATLDINNFLISAEKQNKRRLKYYSSLFGNIGASLVGIGEGVVGAVALAITIPVAAAAIPLGLLVFVAGATLNRFLLMIDSIGLFQAMNFNRFSVDNKGLPLSWMKTILNYASWSLSFVGTGLVFASVFLTEFLKMMHKAVASLHPGLQATFLTLSWAFAVPVALAELFGISALIHMANNGMIKDGIMSLVNNITAYFYQRFYVALPGKDAGFFANAWELIKQSPRLLVSLALTATSMAVMAYYLKMTFILFSGMVAGLLTEYFGASAFTAMVIGNSAAGMNALTTFMTFTLPLGKLVIQIAELAIKLSILAASLTVATALAVIGVPYKLLTKAAEVGCWQTVKAYFYNAWDSAISAYSWLTSSSTLVAGGLDRAVTQKQAAEAKVEVMPESTNMSDTIQTRDSINATFKQRVLYPFYLVCNAIGQMFLFLPLGIKSLSNAIHTLEALIQGTRSGAMNLNGVNNNMALLQGGNRLGKNSLFQPYNADQELEANDQERTYFTAAAAA